MQIERIVRVTLQPHLEFSAEAELLEGAFIVMLKTTLFKQKAERKDRGWALKLPAEVCSADYFIQLLDVERRQRIIRYAKQDAKEQRIRFISVELCELVKLNYKN